MPQKQQTFHNPLILGSSDPLLTDLDKENSLIYRTDVSSLWAVVSLLSEVAIRLFLLFLGHPYFVFNVLISLSALERPLVAALSSLL